VEHWAHGASEKRPSNYAFAASTHDDEIPAGVAGSAKDHFIGAPFGNNDVDVPSGKSGFGSFACPSDPRADDLVIGLWRHTATGARRRARDRYECRGGVIAQRMHHGDARAKLRGDACAPVDHCRRDFRVVDGCQDRGQPVRFRTRTNEDWYARGRRESLRRTA
jgi:hypothetical protein